MQSRGVQSMSRVCAGYYNDNIFVTDLILLMYNTYNAPSHWIYWRWNHTTNDRRNKQVGHDKHFQVRHFFQSFTLGGSFVLQNPIFSTNMYLLLRFENPISGKHPKLE